MSRLTLDDISDLRAYEREREEFRRSVIELKRIRRVPIGPIVTVVFENRTTIRFQIQEMARAEAMLADEQIRAELDIYNPLIPARGAVSLTLFVELRSEEELREWLPKLAGIERAVELRLADPDETVRSMVEEAHASQLTRDETTASVHYIRFELTPEQQERFAAGPAWIAVEHQHYSHRTALSDETRRSLVADWA